MRSFDVNISEGYFFNNIPVDVVSEDYYGEFHTSDISFRIDRLRNLNDSYINDFLNDAVSIEVSKINNDIVLKIKNEYGASSSLKVTYKQDGTIETKWA